VAALDAAAGRAWSREDPAEAIADGRERAGRAKGSDRWWQTQRRLLARQVVWLGVAPERAGRELVAADLGVVTLLLRERARELGRRPGYRSRGKAICAVLAALPRTRLLDRLLASGHRGGLWGAPYRWDPARRALSRVFRGVGTRAPPPRP
jgi:hypothetical protein